MPRINLLPWREEERKKRQRDFLIAMSGAFVAALVALGLTMFAYSGMIDHQNARNTRLQGEIATLDKSIKEIDGLEAQKERLLARMEIIEQLQKSRPEIVHLFDEVTRQLPEGVYLTGLEQSGISVKVNGVAQSSTRVSALMRQMDDSDWLADPNLAEIESFKTGPARQSRFSVTMKQVGQSTEEDVDGDMEDAG
jgi:type IV pilus assembly protein PilN